MTYHLPAPLPSPRHLPLTIALKTASDAARAFAQSPTERHAPYEAADLGSFLAYTYAKESATLGRLALTQPEILVQLAEIDSAAHAAYVARLLRDLLADAHEFGHHDDAPHAACPDCADLSPLIATCPRCTQDSACVRHCPCGACRSGEGH